MNAVTQKIGTTALLFVLSILSIQPALADPRRGDRQERQHQNQNYQRYSQSYYDHQYQKYRERRQGKRHDRYSGYGYSHDQQYRRLNYGNDIHQVVRYASQRPIGHSHHNGIVVLSGPTHGFSRCEVHGGYYRSGDIYY